VSLVLVSGLSGTGKSTVYRRLRERGFEAWGLDEDQFGEWLHRESGLPVSFPTDRHDSDGSADLEFTVHHDKLEGLAQRSSGRTVFLCGGAGHEFHFWQLLDLVIYLTVDDETLRRRLANRTDNGYGKTAQELDGILKANKNFETFYQERGAVIIDAARPIDQVMTDVLNAAEVTSSS
jgi:broad-specificity NMP kinase